MLSDENKKPSQGRDGSDNKPLDSQRVRRVLSRVSVVLRKHAEILAFFEAKKTHDALHIVGRCKIYKIATQTQTHEHERK